MRITIEMQFRKLFRLLPELKHHLLGSKLEKRARSKFSIHVLLVSEKTTTAVTVFTNPTCLLTGRDNKVQVRKVNTSASKTQPLRTIHGLTLTGHRHTDAG